MSGVPEDLARDPEYMRLYAQVYETRAKMNEHAPVVRSAFASCTFGAMVQGIKMNSVGGVVITLETSYADADEAWQMGKASGEELNVHVTRKL